MMLPVSFLYSSMKNGSARGDKDGFCNRCIWVVTETKKVQIYWSK